MAHELLGLALAHRPTHVEDILFKHVQKHPMGRALLQSLEGRCGERLEEAQVTESLKSLEQKLAGLQTAGLCGDAKWWKGFKQFRENLSGFSVKKMPSNHRARIMDMKQRSDEACELASKALIARNAKASLSGSEGSEKEKETVLHHVGSEVCRWTRVASLEIVKF